jgi:phosphohistidine phosphatase SixA
MRHGNAENSYPDHKRCLTNIGIEQVTQAAYMLKQHGVDRINELNVSPYTRAKETALALQKVIKIEKTVVREDLVPSGNSHFIVDEIKWTLSDDVAAYRSKFAQEADSLDSETYNCLIISHIPMVNDIIYGLDLYQSNHVFFYEASWVMIDYNQWIMNPKLDYMYYSSKDRQVINMCS